MVWKGTVDPFRNFSESGAVVFGSLRVQYGRVKVVYFTPWLYRGQGRVVGSVPLLDSVYWGVWSILFPNIFGSGAVFHRTVRAMFLGHFNGGGTIYLI